MMYQRHGNVRAHVNIHHAHGKGGAGKNQTKIYENLFTKVENIFVRLTDLSKLGKNSENW